MMPPNYYCVVCGEPRPSQEPWFLLAENHWPDRLKILEWNEHLAHQPGIYCVCSALHVEQLVVHWMTAGSLGYPFALPAREKRPRRISRAKELLPAGNEMADTGGARLIGELAVDRISLLRVLKDSPESLTAILEALVGALRRESAKAPDQLEYEDLELCATHREV